MPKRRTVADLWVVNSSPLITLAKVEQLPLLTGHGRQLLIPEQVAGEVMAGLEDDPARLALEGGFGAPLCPVSIDPEVLGWSLGAGESAVLSAARVLGATAILDDGAARKAARTLGIRLTGTLGLVIAGAKSGQVSSATQIIRELRAAGLRLDDRAITDALARFLGETWIP